MLVSILNVADIVAPLAAIIFFIWKWRFLSSELRLVFGFCLIQFACNTLATVLSIFHTNNYIVYISNTFLSFLVLFYLFTKYLVPVKKPVAVLTISLFFFLTAILLYQGDGVSTYNSIGSALASLLIVALCLYFFYSKLINSSPEVSIPATAIFWSVIGIFTYFAGSFFIFITYKYMIANEVNTVGTLWRFHNLLLVICNMYIIYGVLCKSYRAI